MPKPITQADLARRFGVSQNTISSAMRGLGRIRPELRQRIIDTAAEMGYRPNHSGRAMVTGRFWSLGLVLSDQPGRSNIPQGLLNGIVDGTAAHRLHLQVAKIPDQTLRDGAAAPRALHELSCDGLLINYTHTSPPELTTLLRTSGMPAIYLNRDCPEDGVRPDDFAAGERAWQLLAGMGCRRIAYADLLRTIPFAATEHYSSSARHAGFLSSAAIAGKEALVWHPAEKHYHGWLAPMAEQFLRADPTVDGVVCATSSVAIGMVEAAYALGRRVGQDLTLLTFDDSPVGHIAGGLPTLVLPHKHVGYAAVAMAVAKLEDPGPRPTSLLPFRWFPNGVDEHLEPATPVFAGSSKDREPLQTCG